MPPKKTRTTEETPCLDREETGPKKEIVTVETATEGVGDCTRQSLVICIVDRTFRSIRFDDSP